MHLKFAIAIIATMLLLVLAPSAFSTNDIPPLTRRVRVPETLPPAPAERFMPLKPVLQQTPVWKTAPLGPSAGRFQETKGKPNFFIRFLRKIGAGKPEIRLFGAPVGR